MPAIARSAYDEYITIKSKNGFAFRRYTLSAEDVQSFHRFYKKIEAFHQLNAIPFVIFYYDSENFPLPINNDDNLAKAISSAKPFPKHNNSSNNNNNNNNHINNNNNNSYTNGNYQQLQFYQHHHQQQQQPYHHHYQQQQQQQLAATSPCNRYSYKRRLLEIYVESKEKSLDYLNGKYGKRNQHFKNLSNLILSSNESGSSRPSISMPENFRQVSSIIDVDILPESCRRVKIVKHGSDRPLGFFIRDGQYRRMNAQGQLEMVTGIFISRLVPGGLAESTGLLVVNDEVLEVNGIKVTHGKTLDQVTDMMVANSSNLIITVRPGKVNDFS